MTWLLSKTVLNIFTFCHRCSGLKINIDKTFANYIGSLKYSDYLPYGWLSLETNIENLSIVIITSEEQN